MKRILLITMVAMLAVSCTTISQKAAMQEAEDLVLAVGSGDVEKATAMSSRPFLFESEILVSQTLVSDLWAGLTQLDFSSAEVTGYTVIDEDSSSFFNDSWEVQTWLENYADGSTAMVFFNWNNRELVVIVDRRAGVESRIQGFGEVQ